MFANGMEHITTAEIQQVVQKEHDTCKARGHVISAIEIDYGAVRPLVVSRDELEFFKGRFVVGRFSDGVEYIPVENVLSIGFQYEALDEGDVDEVEENP